MSWDLAADVLAGACLLAGAFLSLTAAVGVARFEGLLARMHAATKPQVLGMLFILVGVGVRLRSLTDMWLLVAVALFQLLTTPVAAHMVGRAAYRHHLVGHEELVVDELGPVLDQNGNNGSPPRPSE